MSSEAGSKNAGQFQAIVPSNPQDVVIGATSQQSTAFDVQCTIIRIKATTDCRVSIGSNPTAHIVGDSLIGAGDTEYFGLVGPTNKIAVISAFGATGICNVTEGKTV